MPPRWWLRLEWTPRALWLGMSWVWIPDTGSPPWPGAVPRGAWHGIVGLLPGLLLHVVWRRRETRHAPPSRPHC
jgi:hypothetical protein